MSTSNDNNTRFDQYLNNELNEQQRSLFEDRLTNETDFNSEFELHKDLVNAIKDDGDQDMKSFFKNIEGGAGDNPSAVPVNEATTAPKGNSNRIAKFLLGFVIGFSIVMGLYWFTERNKTEPKAAEHIQMASHFSPYENDFIRMERSGEVKAAQKAMMKYNKGDFAAAAADFKDIYDQTGDNNVNFYRAISLIGSDDAQGARAILLNLGKLENFKYADQVRWYDVLAALGIGDTTGAAKKLKGLIATGQSFKLEEAKSLLAKLES